MTAQSADAAREPLGIVFLTLQVVEETKELVPGSIPFEFAVQRFCFAERLLLHRQRRFQVNLGRVHRFVAEPQGDHRAVHALLQKVHGRGVPQAVNCHAFVLQ